MTHKKELFYQSFFVTEFLQYTPQKKPQLSGFSIKCFDLLLNTRFGKLIILPNALGKNNVEIPKFRAQKCNFGPTFAPIKYPKSV